MLTIFTVIAPMVVAALFLLNGKGAFLIAGYNTLSKEEKAKYDEKALCRFTGRLLLIVSFCALLIPTSSYFEMEGLAFCGVAATSIISIGACVYANTGNRFRSNVISEVPVAKTKTYSVSKADKFAAYGLVIFCLAMPLIFIVGNVVGNKDPVVNILENRVQIKGIYGLNIDFTDITDVSLVEKSMWDIGFGRRTNGYYAGGQALKGYFEQNNLLFVQSKTSPTIRIKRSKSEDVYISFLNSEATRILYNELAVAISVKE